MPTFIDMSKLTKRSTLTGNEEFQVSATEKVTSQQIANLFNAMQAKLTGFANQTTGVTSISSASTILQAFQNMYRIVGNGGVKIVTNGLAYNGFVCWSGSTCYGIVFNVTDNIMYTRNAFTQNPPTALTDQQWIDAIVNSGSAFRMDADMVPLSITDFKGTVNNARVQKLPVGGIIPFYSTGGDQKPTDSALIGILQKVSAGQINFFAQDVGSNNFYLGNAITTLIKWTQIGAGGSGLDVISLEGGNQIGNKIVAADWGDNPIGKVKAIYVDLPIALTQAYFPSFQGASSLTGIVQCVQGEAGNATSYRFLVTLYPYFATGVLTQSDKDYGCLIISGSGNVNSYSEYPRVTVSPIPGYTLLVSKWNFTVCAETARTYRIVFNKAVSKYAKLLVAGVLHQTSDTNSDVIHNIPLTPVNVNPSTGRGALVEFSSGFLSTTSSPAAFRFLVSSAAIDASGKVTSINVTYNSTNISIGTNLALQLDIYCDE